MIHKNSIKEIIIKDYLNKYNKAPTQQEIKSHYNDYTGNKPEALDNGISSTSNVSYPLVTKNSSAAQFNALNEALAYDFKALNESLILQREYLEDLFRTSYQQEENILKQLKGIERTINKNLLLSSKDDIFSYGIVEDFENYDKVDFQNSNVYFFNNKVTVDLDSVSLTETNNHQIYYEINSRSNNLLQQKTTNSINNIKYEDGTFFKIIVNSKHPADLIECIFTIDFTRQDSSYVDTLKFVTNAIEMNSKLSYKCFYTTDMVNYNEVFESNLRVTENENFIEVNKENVKQIKFILAKDKYDYIDGDEYSFVFTLDCLLMLNKTFKENVESVLYLGPYKVLDENEAPVNFSLATLKGGTCCIVPDTTSIDFYLSKDNSNWISASFHNSHKEIVQFNEIDSSLFDESIFTQIDSDSNNLYMADQTPEYIELKSNEKLLNYKIDIEDKEKFIKKSLKIKRNVFDRNIKERLYNAYSGWYKDDQDNYVTNINITQPEGRYINFGNTSCYLNEKLVTGKVFIPYGIHSFKTNSLNYSVIKNEKVIKNANQLKQQDRLYPYNHKYLIEGFPYNRNFVGRRLYYGVDELFSFYLKEVSNQKFEISNDLDIFTILEVDQGLFFKIKTNATSGEGSLERFDIECKKRANINEGNDLYIKAVLKTFNTKVTPKIDQIQVRVI